MTTHRYPRRVIPLWWSWHWRQLRRRLLTRRPPEPFEPGYDAWLRTQLPLIADALRRARRERADD
jgi:hypothetical protein